MLLVWEVLEEGQRRTAAEGVGSEEEEAGACGHLDDTVDASCEESSVGALCCC